MAILEFLAKIYGRSGDHSERLFQTFQRWLCGTELRLPFIAEVDEMASVRYSISVAFSRLIQQVVQSVPPEVSPSRAVVGAACAQLQPLTPLKKSCFIRCMPLPDILQLFPSRFQEEFVELGVLGKGGFGKVMKVKNRIDGCEYAVKRVVFKQLNRDTCTRVLREVKVFASLDHSNIVRYHSAWLEHLTEDLTTIREEFDHSATDEDDSIVFASGLGQTESADAAKTNDSTCSLLTDCRNFEQLGQVDTASLTGQMSQTSRGIMELASTTRSGESESDSHCCFQTKDKQLCPLSAATCRPSRQRHVQAPRLVLYIQMQLCSQSLREWLVQRNQTISSPMKCAQVSSKISNSIFRQIVEGVHYIHTRGLMHRDLKPANIFLYGSEEAKIGDFGLARDEMVFEHAAESGRLKSVVAGRESQSQRQQQPSCYCLSNSSTPTSGIGTSTYAPPEQLQGSVYDAKADMFSLGLILAELFHPFPTEMERGLCLRGVREGHLPVELSRTWPQQSQLIEQLVSNDPSKRPDSTAVLRMDFLKIEDELIEQLRAQVDKLTELLAEKDDIITLLKQQLREAKSHT
ncbi:eukaryotic translation initiation factor 2-alpha kinase 1-like isoform X2 [Corticium candelabrum]|nr:eukaryotic translation initiation factor 2-alpha kinase 1-like isoform X2 [Corticium candelabrum]